MLLVGISYGSVLGDLESFFTGNAILEQMLLSEAGTSLTEQFIPMLMVVMAILGTIPPLMAVNKLYGEEKNGRIEHLLGRSVSRTRLMVGYVILSAVNGFVMLSLTAIGLWAAGTTVMEEPFTFGTIYGAAVVYYPAVLVMIGVAAVLMGCVPRLHSLIWLYVLYSFVVIYLGGVFQFAGWVGKLSPYGHIPELPVAEMEVVPISILTALAIALMAIGVIGYNKRDIQG